MSQGPNVALPHLYKGPVWDVLGKAAVTSFVI